MHVIALILCKKESKLIFIPPYPCMQVDVTSWDEGEIRKSWHVLIPQVIFK